MHAHLLTFAHAHTHAQASCSPVSVLHAPVPCTHARARMCTHTCATVCLQDMPTTATSNAARVPYASLGAQFDARCRYIAATVLMTIWCLPPHTAPPLTGTRMHARSSVHNVGLAAGACRRKRFREQTNKHDNEFHDRATDSLINYETARAVPYSAVLYPWAHKLRGWSVAHVCAQPQPPAPSARPAAQPPYRSHGAAHFCACSADPAVGEG